jgi:hypothetical protein
MTGKTRMSKGQSLKPMRMWLSSAGGGKDNENKVPELLFHQSLTNCLNPETCWFAAGAAANRIPDH